MTGEKRGTGPADQDARRAVTFMLAKFALFAVAPVIAAALIVYFTLPQ
jgi:hypothetical protein